MPEAFEIKKPKVEKVAENLYLITLYPPVRGFEEFIGIWLYMGEVKFIVDVGPAVTSAGLIRVLEDFGPVKPDYILLTHIHVDHAGGIGEISDHFPETPIICHKVGIPHLVDPERLWKGTVKILGDTALTYGPFKSVPSSRLFDARNFSSDQITPVITPGHAAHHVSFVCDPYLFVGEAGGVFLKTDNDNEYLRPATPPQFFLKTSVESIDKLLVKCPGVVCYGHFGIRNGAREMLSRHKNQLFLWAKIIKNELERYPGKNYISGCLNRLLQEDPLLSGFFRMNKAVRERERGFLANSIKGFVGFLEGL